MRKKEKQMTAKIKPIKEKRFFVILISAFLALVIIFGAVLGIVSAVKRSKTAVSFGGLWIDVETASFFASQYKARFMSSVSASGITGVEDSPGFWNSTSEMGESYLTLLNRGVREYIGAILASNYLFDRYSRLTSDDKKIISDAVEATVTYRADGSLEKFNEAASEYGFSYSSFKKAATMLYKATLAMEAVCGSEGENFKGEEDLISDYIKEYSHVRLLFIRTEKTYLLDSGGEKVVDNDGSYKLRDLTDDEKAERAALIAEIRSYIDAIGTDEAAMGSEMFDLYLEGHDEGDRTTHDYGYYLHRDSDFSKAFGEQFPKLSERIYEMEVGSFGEAEVDFGVCFIYKYSPVASDVEVGVLEDFFLDFYYNLSEKFYNEQLALVSSEVKFSEKFDTVDMLLIPKNHILVPTF